MHRLSLLVSAALLGITVLLMARLPAQPAQLAITALVAERRVAQLNVLLVHTQTLLPQRLLALIA